MGGLLSVSLVTAGLAVFAIAHPCLIHDLNPVHRRKSAVFRSRPYQIETNSFPHSPQSDPIEVARRFVRDHLDGRLTPHNTFTIRK